MNHSSHQNGSSRTGSCLCTRHGRTSGNSRSRTSRHIKSHFNVVWTDHAHTLDYTGLTKGMISGSGNWYDLFSTIAEKMKALTTIKLVGSFRNGGSMEDYDYDCGDTEYMTMRAHKLTNQFQYFIMYGGPIPKFYAELRLAPSSRITSTPPNEESRSPRSYFVASRRTWTTTTWSSNEPHRYHQLSQGTMLERAAFIFQFSDILSGKGARISIAT